MRSHALALGLAVILQACGVEDLHRFAGIPQGTLAVGIGVPMREVVRRSSVRLHRSPSGPSKGSYDNGNAYFDFELLGSSLRFHGCSMYFVDYEGPDETVKSISVYITPDRHRWWALRRELRETAAKLTADGWDPHPYPGWEPLETFLARDGAKVGSSDSGAIATFAWRKAGLELRVTANRAWDAAQFWSSLSIVPADFWDAPAMPSPKPRLGEPPSSGATPPS